jgi:nucleoside 2-deoxyribosyltransferase
MYPHINGMIRRVPVSMDGEKKSATDIVQWIMKKIRATDIVVICKINAVELH